MVYLPLARKYRPKTFNDVIGQKTIISSLLHSLNTLSLSQAYLLTGTRGIGKTTLARLIAMAVNCEDPKHGEPCTKCENCIKIIQGFHPDVTEIDGASKTRIDDLKPIIETFSLQPMLARYKVFIIDEVHMLSNHSFNALLKPLEEPKSNIIFILATTETDKIPITVKSRCIHYPLLPFTKEEIVSRIKYILKNENIRFDENIDAIAEAANGSMRDALTLMEQIIQSGQGQVLNDKVFEIIGSVPDRLFKKWLSTCLTSDIKKLQITLDEIKNTHANTKVMLEKIATYLHEKCLEEINTEKYNKLEEAYNTVLNSIKQLPFAPQNSIHLQMTFLKIWHIFNQTENSNAKKIIIHVKHNEKESINNEKIDYTKIIQEHAPNGLIGQALRNMKITKEEKINEITHLHILYPLSQNALFQENNQKKIIEFLAEKTQKKIQAKFTPYAEDKQVEQKKNISENELNKLKNLGYQIK